MFTLDTCKCKFVESSFCGISCFYYLCMFYCIQIGEAKFLSAQYRLFKKPRKTINTPLQVSYREGIAGFEKKLKFDIQWRFDVSG